MKNDQRTKSKSRPKNKAKNELKKSQKNEFQIILIEDRCKGCGLCVLFCPNDVLEMSRDVNKTGTFIPLVKNPSNCTGCNRCFKFCPDFAIYCKNKKNNET